MRYTMVPGKVDIAKANSKTTRRNWKEKDSTQQKRVLYVWQDLESVQKDTGLHALSVDIFSTK